MLGFVFSQHPTFATARKYMKGSKSKRSEKKERKRARKRFEMGNGKKLPLPVNTENATTVWKIRIFFYCVKKTLLHGELFSEIYFQSSSEFTVL